MIPDSNNAKRRFHQDHQENFAVIPRIDTQPYRKALTKGEMQPMKRDYIESRETPQPAPDKAPGHPVGQCLLAVCYETVTDAVSGTMSGVAADVNKDLARYVFWAVAALLAAAFAMNLGAEAAFAQAKINQQAIEKLNRLADSLPVKLWFDDDRNVQVARPASTVREALGVLLGLVLYAQASGEWSRLRACANPGCRWIFYDASKNRVGSWCRMATCGNQAKSRTHRERIRASGNGSSKTSDA